MKTYISVLRGINVGGHKIIKMSELKKMYEDLGFKNVHTYIQSGNVIFQSDDTSSSILAENSSTQIHTHFGFEVPTIVLDQNQLRYVITNNPYANNADLDQSHLGVSFLSSTPIKTGVELIKQKLAKGEELTVSDEAVYLYCPIGFGKSKITITLLESKLEVRATTRNWKTTTKLLSIAQELI